MGLKIAVWHDPPAGGAQRSLSEMLSGLARRGHRIDIFRLGVAHRDATSETAYGLSTEVIPFEPTPHRTGRMFWNDLLTWRDWTRVEELEGDLARRIDGAGYDVVLVSVLRWGMAPNLLRFCSTPTVYYCHEPTRRFYEPWCRPEAGPLSAFERARLMWRWPARRLLDRRAQTSDAANVRAATLVLTNSRYTQSRIRAVYGRDASVCYLGVNATAFTPASPGERRHGVVTVGALEPHKGFDFVIRALGQVPAALRPPLTLVGSHGHPNMPRYLARLAHHAGVRLDLVRGLSDAELAGLYRSSQAFVWGARMEPFGLVLLEAMASGLPVIAVDEGGVPEIVQHGATGYLCPRDPTAFAHQLSAVLADPSLRNRLGAAARHAAETEWTWERTVATLEQHLVAATSRVRQGTELAS